MDRHANPASAPRSKDTLVLRVASAAALAPLAIGASWLGGPVFAGLVAFLCVLMAFEWARMVERAEMTPVFYALGLGGAAAMILAAAEHYAIAYVVCAASGVVAAAASLKGSGNWRWAAFGAAYFIAPSIALVWLRESVEDGRGLLLLLFAIVWAADTGGYIGGRLVGGPKLVERALGETWAGAIGGLIAGAIAALIGAPLIFGAATQGAYFAMGAGLGFASIVGDMLESAFKRAFGIKDMSGFIPGHGGVLDRLDGMIVVTMAVTAALYGHSLLAGLRG